MRRGGAAQKRYETAPGVFRSFDHLEDGDELWHIDPKDKDPRSEEARQIAVLRDARVLCPAVDFFAVPNAGKRSQWAAMKAKREGMRAGALDLVATWAGGVAFIEMKDGTSMPDANQRDRLNMYVRQGHFCGVFRQERSVMEFLKRCGAPFVGWYS
jgi:hypothetical protein